MILQQHSIIAKLRIRFLAITKMYGHDTRLIPHPFNPSVCSLHVWCLMDDLPVNTRFCELMMDREDSCVQAVGRFRDWQFDGSLNGRKYLLVLVVKCFDASYSKRFDTERQLSLNSLYGCTAAVRWTPSQLVLVTSWIFCECFEAVYALYCGETADRAVEVDIGLHGLRLNNLTLE